MNEDKELIERCERLFGQMQTEREGKGWNAHWLDLAEHMAPQRGRFLKSTRDNKNDGSKKHDKIINGVIHDAARTLAAGLQGGMTSPSRPWFLLGIADRDLMEYAPVKEWLYLARNVMFDAFGRSNFYGMTYNTYYELGLFGSAAALIEEDLGDLWWPKPSFIYSRPFTIGEYWLATNSKQRVDTLFRKFSMTVKQLIDTFGKEVLPNAVVSTFNGSRGSEQDFSVVHAVFPNNRLEIDKSDYRGMAYSSIYYLEDNHEFRALRKGGYRTRPFIAPRWLSIATDIYGVGPGMDALADVRMLQKIETKKLKGLDKQVDPPMTAPLTMKGEALSIVSGDVTFVDDGPGQKGFAPAYQVQLNFRDIGVEIESVVNRIRTFFYNPLFLAVLNEDKRMTATEVAERHAEKLGQLGPVLYQLQDEMLDPIIDRVFSILMEFDMLPPAPPEIRGMDLKIEYISTLAQAQRILDTRPIEQTAAFVANFAQLQPEVLDKFNFDEAVDQFSTAAGVIPGIVRTDDEVAEIRQQRLQQLQQQRAQESLPGLAKSMKDLGQTPVAKDNLLGQVAEGLGKNII